MSKKLPISKDIVNTDFIADESEGKFHIERSQDVTPVIEDHKRFKQWLNNSDNRAFRVWTGTV